MQEVHRLRQGSLKKYIKNKLKREILKKHSQITKINTLYEF
jgi:hypothetical protein